MTLPVTDHRVINAQDHPDFVTGAWPMLPPKAEIARALDGDKTARRIQAKAFELTPGMLCGSRLNINVLKTTGIAVNSVHLPTNKSGYQANRGFWNGTVVRYEPVVQLDNAFFSVHQVLRERIARGEIHKLPMADVAGHLNSDPYRFDGVEVRFNPAHAHLFVDRAGRAIHWAEQATVVGHRVFVRGRLGYYLQQSAPERAGQSATCAHFGDPASTVVGPCFAPPAARQA